MKEKIIRYVKETVVELNKVTWPTKDEIIGSTIITIFVTLVMSVFTFGIDWSLSKVISSILG